ncbi:MAG TPA: hypothetical protein PLR74_18710, partial [Agriterribacter sp.]|nr:hypothetical protein [Agriterribacter sp.]
MKSPEKQKTLSYFANQFHNVLNEIRILNKRLLFYSFSNKHNQMKHSLRRFSGTCLLLLGI